MLCNLKRAEEKLRRHMRTGSDAAEQGPPTETPLAKLFRVCQWRSKQMFSATSLSAAKEPT